MPNFAVKKSRKVWEFLILSVQEKWELARVALQSVNEDIEDDIVDKVDSISFLDDLGTYLPLECIAITNTVYKHDVPLEESFWVH